MLCGVFCDAIPGVVPVMIPCLETTDILDIHTHKQEVDTQGKSIINYPLLADSPLYMPLAENVEVAVGRGSYYSIGIHPWEVRESNVSQQLSFLQQQLQRKQFVAVG